MWKGCTAHSQHLLSQLHNCLCPNIGVPEDGRDLTAEAAAERLSGRRRPQAERDRQPQGFAEGERGKDGDAGEAE